MAYKFENVHLCNRRTAEKVLDGMKEVAELYGVVLVADLYDLAGVRRASSFDYEYGWVSSQLNNTKISRVGSCDYFIALPKPVPVEDDEMTARPMTYREKLQMEHPDAVSPSYMGGCNKCPKSYGYGPECCGNAYCFGKCFECWNKEYKEYKGEKEMATVNSFKKEDIKAGYVIRLRNGSLRHIAPVGKEGTLIAVDAYSNWGYVSNWDSDFDYARGVFEAGYPRQRSIEQKNMDITEVYGYVSGTANYPLVIAGPHIETRPLLWKRTAVKKMTVAEINAALGYEVEIVAEKE